MDLIVALVKLLSEFYLSTKLIILGSIWYLICGKDKSSIPGPKPWPLVGNVLQVGLKPYVTFLKWGKVYGPIMHLNIFKRRMIVSNDLKTIRELFNNPLTTGRETSINPLIYELCQGTYGVSNAEGESWEAQRRFTVRTLREFGFEKESIEGIIMTEVNALMNWIKERNGRPLTGNKLFDGPLVNVIGTMVSSERCDWADKKGSAVQQVQKFIEYVYCSLDKGHSSLKDVTDSGLYFAPFLRYIFPKKMGWTPYKKNIEDLVLIFNETVERHKETLDKSCLRDYIDCYLKEIDEMDNEHSSFYKNN